VSGEEEVAQPVGGDRANQADELGAVDSIAGTARTLSRLTTLDDA